MEQKRLDRINELARKSKVQELTEEEKRYMENLFPEAADFEFTHPDRVDATQSVTSRAYRSKYGINWKNARTGIWGSYSFSIIQC